MAQKFGNFRWVKEGYLDSRAEGTVVGCLTFAGLGPVDFCLKGHMAGEIAGKAIRFLNSRYVDDPSATEVLADFEIPQVGKVSLISFDPHPLLPPHPYVEWFSFQQQHYRIELAVDDAWIMEEEEVRAFDHQSQTIRSTLLPLLERSSSTSSSSPPNEWF